MIARQSTLDRVRRGRLCTGCGGCAAISAKIAMAESADGFRRPVLDAPLTPEEDRRIAEICPGVSISGAESTDPLWGRVVSLRSGHASDPDLRFRASSGGALSAVLVHLLKSEAVDGVIHTAADPSDPVANRTVVSRSPEEIARASGSRYAPSSPLEGIDAHLQSGERFAFVGKPCDVAALRAMARQDPRIDRQIPVMLSFFCAGIPSRTGAQEILSRLGVRPDHLAWFRYRGHGWPGTARAGLRDGTQRNMSYRESWGGILTGHVQFRCRICPDGTGNAADLVFADAWHGDDSGYPSFEEAEGRSLIVARTPRGEALAVQALAADAVRAEDECMSNLPRMQPGQATRMRVLLARLAALVLMAQPIPAFRGFRLFRAAREAPAGLLLRNFVGTGRRVLLGRRG